MLKACIHRDCDTLRLRKVIIEIYDEATGDLVDSSRMFAGLFFERRLSKRLKKAVFRANIMLKASKTKLL